MELWDSAKADQIQIRQLLKCAFHPSHCLTSCTNALQSLKTRISILSNASLGNRESGASLIKSGAQDPQTPFDLVTDTRTSKSDIGIKNTEKG
jgi:hypothetical protein